MAYSSVRSIEGGKSVKKTSRQAKNFSPKPAPVSTVSSKTGAKSYKGTTPRPIVAAPKTGPSSRAKARRKLLRKVRKVEDDFSKLAAKDRKAFEKLTSPERMEARAQKRAKKLWQDTKDISGLAGKMPKVIVGDPGVAGRGNLGEAGYDSDTVLLSNMGLGAPWKKTKRAAQDVLIHEFAHIGQGRARGVPDTKREARRREGRAERFSKIGMRKLFKSGQKAPSYPREVQRSQRHDPKRRIRYAQFKDKPRDRREKSVTPWWETGAQRAKGRKGQTVSAATGAGSYKRTKPTKQPKTKAPKPKPEPKKPEKLGIDVPEIVPPQFRKTVAKQGQRLNEAVAGTGMTGPEYLAKLIQFESGWSPTAENPSSAYGLGQFIDTTAQDFRERLGVETQDPKRPRQMIKGAAIHASGKAGYDPLYAGYNPGYSSEDPIPAVPSGNNVRVKVPRKAVERVAGGEITSSRGLLSGATKLKPEQKDTLKAMVKEATKIDKANKPYVYGGGHVAGKVPGIKKTNYDCSSVTSRILQKAGVLPKSSGALVSGDFMNYGAPGPGTVTIFANDGHVFMRIGNKYFGTSSQDNTGSGGFLRESTGAAEAASGEYTVRHVPELGKAKIGLKGLPSFPGVSLSNGGTTATVTSSTTLTTPGSSSKPITPAKRKAKRIEGRKRSQTIRKLIAEGPAEIPVAEVTRTTTPYSERVKKAPVRLGL